MIIIMKRNAPDDSLDLIKEHLISNNFDIHQSTGANRTIIGVIGNTTSLDDETLSWANKGLEEFNTSVVQKDCNGVVLNAGDTVTIIKDLEVKGAGFTAKRGTAVRNISLGSEEGQIEGRVNGVKIVILTQFVKKS